MNPRQHTRFKRKTLSTHVALALLALSSNALAGAAASSGDATTSDTGAAPTLATVNVSGKYDLDATTEGSTSYAARAATIAGKTPQKLQEIPNSVSVITRQRMDDQNMATLADAMQYTTGVKNSYFPMTGAYSSRGYLMGVEFDGVPVLSGIQYVPQLDLSFYDRIEVFRGPAGVMDGIGNPGGTVNLVRKRPMDTFHISTETQVSSFDGARQTLDVTGPLNKEGTLRGRAVVAGSDMGVVA